MKNVVFRADSSRQIGYGHVMRCLALADALRDRGYSCLFVASQDGMELEGEVAARGHRQIALSAPIYNEEADAEATLESLRAEGELSAFVVDHYSLGRYWETRIRQAGAPILAIDDLFRSHDCDLLLDQNVIDSTNPYVACVPASCRCFLGPHYALLRPEFARLRAETQPRLEVRRILIFFGGSDTDNETGKALCGLLSAKGTWSIDVVIGATNPHRAEIETLCSACTDYIHLHVQTSHMAELMGQADLALGAGGSASWERCCLRLPTIVSILAENQAPIAIGLDRMGATLNLGDATHLTPADYAAAVVQLDGPRLRAMSEAAGALTDGQGAARVAAGLQEFLGSMQ